MGRRKPSYFIEAKEAPAFWQAPGLETRVLTGLDGERMMMVLRSTLPGHTFPLHRHDKEQIGIVYSGRARLRIGDEERTAGRGDFYCIPANVLHGDTCIGDKPFVMLDIFYPIRDDLVKKLRTDKGVVCLRPEWYRL
jgi:quercetin dioxygenase-like cupin family protein